MHSNILCVAVVAIWILTGFFTFLSFYNWQTNPDNKVAYQRLIKMVAIYGIASSIFVLHAAYHR